MSFINTNFITQWVNSPYAIGVLGALSLSESAFFIIPPEVLLIPMALANKEMALLFGVITIIFSVVGAIIGYGIGKKGGKPILQKLFSNEKIEKVKIMFHRYDSGAIFISAFTPIPFKVFTIAAGVFDLNFAKFLVASFLGRGTRYMLLVGLIYVFGNSIRYFLEHQFDKFILLATLGVIGGVAVYKFAIPYLEKKFLGESIKEKLHRLLGGKH